MAFSLLNEIGKVDMMSYKFKTDGQENQSSLGKSHIATCQNSPTSSYREDLTHDLRKVWRYVKCDHSEFEEEHTMQ
jgi:hypothetical protein